jgi:hypothetical protein
MDEVPGSGKTRSAAGRLALLELRAAVIRAGEVVAEARRGTVDVRSLVAARRNHVSAMTAYEGALQAMSLPVPRQLRADLRLQSRVVAMSDRTASSA